MNNNIGTQIKGFSNCCEIYLMNHNLLQKQERISISTQSPNQYPNIKTKASDEIQPLNEYEDRTVAFDDMLLSKQESKIYLFFTR